jgi:hypothetical protein
MFKVIYKTIRPSTKTLFFPRSKEMEELVLLAKADGRLLEDATVFSDDKLIRTYTATWISKEALGAFNNNDIVKEFVKRRRWYEQENDHTQNNISMEVDDDE